MKSQRNLCILFSLILFVGAARGFDERFPLPMEYGYPIAGEAWYSIKAVFLNNPPAGQGAWSVSRVTVNGTRARDFLVFQNGRETAIPEINGDQPFDLKIRWGWQGKAGYEVKVDLEHGKTKKTLTLTEQATAPAKKGYWNSGWKNYSPRRLRRQRIRTRRLSRPCHGRRVKPLSQICRRNPSHQGR